MSNQFTLSNGVVIILLKIKLHNPEIFKLEFRFAEFLESLINWLKS